MKFKFEFPMKKGQCYTCPMCYRDDEHFYDICQLNGEMTCMEVNPDECPLEEEE